MKNIISFLIINSFLGSAFAQITVEALPKVENDTLLVLEVYAKSDGKEYTLGSSELPFRFNKDQLKVAYAKVSEDADVRFSQGYDSKSYYPISKGQSEERVAILVKEKVAQGKGQKITSENKKIGKISIPIKNPCDTLDASWFNKRISLTEYSQDIQANEISQYATFGEIKKIALDGGKINKKPTLDNSGSKLESDITEGQFVWYHNGDILSGENGFFVEPKEEGKYYVEVKNKCGNTFVSDEVFLTVTEIAKMTSQNGLTISPNPVDAKGAIVSSKLIAENWKLILRDIEGKTIKTLKSGNNNKVEYTFIPQAHQLASGEYIISLVTDSFTENVKAILIK